MNVAAAIARMSREEQIQGYRALCAELDEHYKRDVWAWLTEQVWTIDEASQEVLRWPDKGYLRELVAFIDEEPMLALPKSRRVMASWTVAAYCTHRARYFPNNAIYIQSETEEKASYVTDKRCAFIERNLEEPMLRRPFKALHTKEGLVGKLTYEDSGSYLWAIPEGDEKIRAFTPSILVMDESEYQRQGSKSLIAALALAEKKAKVILLSSSNGPLGVLAGICREAGFTRWTG
jgi:hypothetical protein